MNKEILLVVDVFSNEKDIEKEIVFQAIEAALASATRKKHSGDIDARVEIDRETGDYSSFRRWEVLAEPDEEEGLSRIVRYCWLMRWRLIPMSRWASLSKSRWSRLILVVLPPRPPSR